MKSSLPIRLNGQEPVVGLASWRTVEEFRERSMELLTSALLAYFNCANVSKSKKKIVLSIGFSAQFEVSWSSWNTCIRVFYCFFVCNSLSGISAV